MQENNTCTRDFPAPGPSTMSTTTVTRSLIANNKVEQLIDEVQKRPALYKKDLKQYSDINVKKKLWEEVCEVLVSDWGALSVNERKEQGKKKLKTSDGSSSVRNLALADYYTAKKQCLDAKKEYILLQNEKLKLEIEKLRGEKKGEEVK